MSTLRSRSGKPGDLPPADDPFFYGFRYVEKTVKGRRRSVQVSLTREDVLHPREGDFVTQNGPHNQDCAYLHYVVQLQVRLEPDTMVVSDFLVNWGVSGMRGHGPDLGVFRGVAPPHPTSSLNVAETGARPELIIEVTSPSTRSTDLHDKRRHYWKAGVPVYVIVDEQFRRGQRYLRIIPYRRGPRGYLRQPLDSRGWFWLEAVQLWLGQENGRVALYDAQGQRILTPEEEAEHRQQEEQRRIQAEQQVTQEKERTAQAEQQAAQEKERATQAEQGKIQAEQRATQAEQLAVRLRELSRKARQGLASPEELIELERLGG